RDELVLERIAHFGIGPGVAVHDEAPRAPPALQRDDHELLVVGGAGKGRVRPFAPEAVPVVDRRGPGGSQAQQEGHRHDQPSHHESLRCRNARRPFAGRRIRWSNHGQTQDREEPVAITVLPITPHFAAEVGDVRLSKPLAAEDLSAVRAAFTKYAVLVFPDQEFDDESQLDFARNFGPLETTVFKAREDHKLRLHENLADVSNLDAEDRILKTDDRQRLYNLGNQLWHTDSSFKRLPAYCSMLHARSIPPIGGQTAVAALRAASAPRPAPPRRRPAARRGRD